MKKIVTLLAIALSINALAQIPTNGLVRHYTFSGNANDNVNSQHGTVLGAALTTDRFGNSNSAFSFDGVDDYIDLPLSGLLLSEYTYSVWALTNSFPSPNGFTCVLAVGTSREGNTNGGDQSIAARNISGSLNGWGAAGYNSPNLNFLTGEGVAVVPLTWNHIVLTRSANVQRLYVN